ncbi:MAG: cation transporter [Firmicutes bacterium]|nr:cation transporter [Bacillota bacterium]
MKSDKHILIAFLLNFSFSIMEIIGGFLTNSIAIISDAIHDLGDTLSIGIAFLLERKSSEKPNDKYTYGYGRYSVLGAFITSAILCFGAILMIYNSVTRLFNPVEVNYNGMILLAILGVIVNLGATIATRKASSLNEKLVSLHMLEDVLGWMVVLVGAIIMRFTNLSFLDAILSIIVSCFILYTVIKNFKEITDVFLEKAPNDVSVDDIKKCVLSIEKVQSVHHIHIWSIDGNINYATMHVVSQDNSFSIKEQIRQALKKQGIIHTTIEIETENEICLLPECDIKIEAKHSHHHH